MKTAVTEVKPGTELAKAAPTTLATSDDAAAIEFLRENAGQGRENVQSDEVRPPMLRLCQDGSPFRKKQESCYIEGLEAGNLFNNITQQVYDQPLPMIVVSYLGHQNHITDSKGNILERDIPDSDPRTKPTTNERQEWVKPVAQKFMNYLVYLPETTEVVAMTFKSTQLKKAAQMNSLLATPLKIAGQIVGNPPSYARRLKVSTAVENGNGNSWFGYAIRPLAASTLDELQFCKGLAETYAKKKVVVEVDTEVDDSMAANNEDDL
jgi:hypothetical protein